MQTTYKIKTKQITEAVANLCKQANLYLSKDTYDALYQAYEKESMSKAKHVLGQILENIKLASKLQRPLCQDTGIVVVFMEIGQSVPLTGNSLEDAVNLGVAKAYIENYFRKSIVKNPVLDRANTENNTPAVIHTKIVPGNSIKISVSVKGGGSENMSALKMLKPSSEIADIVDFAVETVKNAGAKPCPPVRLGIGIGGTMEYAAYLAKKSLLEKVRSEEELKSAARIDKNARLEYEILKKVNNLKIGTAGLGGDTTVFGVNVLTYPTHIAALPVAININCHSSRHASAEIIGNEIKYNFDDFEYDFKDIKIENKDIYKLDVTQIEEIKNLKAGDEILLSGYIYTARDIAHKELAECINTKHDLPVNIKDKIILYVGPCPAKPDEIIGPAGPTTSARMDKYTPILMENGLLGSIGKGERSEEVIKSIKDNKGIYFVATGGTAVLLAEKIQEAKVVAYPGLGPEAIFELKIKDFPVIVAIDSSGNSIFFAS